jgi:tetratricopeptide (TPR) repeat protein
MALGLIEQAGFHHEKVLRLREEIYTPPHPKLAEALYYSSIVAGASGDAVRRLELLQRAITMQRERNEGNNFPFMIQELTNILLRFDEIDEAEALNNEAIAYVSEVFVDGHDGFRYRKPLQIALFEERSKILLASGDIAGAQMWLQRADSILIKLDPGSQSYRNWQSLQCTHGRLFSRQGRYAEAEEALLICRGEEISGNGSHFRSRPDGFVPIMRENLPVSRTGRSAVDLVELYEAWGKPANAVPYRDEATRYERDLRAERVERVEYLGGS